MKTPIENIESIIKGMTRDNTQLAIDVAGSLTKLFYQVADKHCITCKFRNDDRKCPMADPTAMADNNSCYNHYYKNEDVHEKAVDDILAKYKAEAVETMVNRNKPIS